MARDAMRRGGRMPREKRRYAKGETDTGYITRRDAAVERGRLVDPRKTDDPNIYRGPLTGPQAFGE